MPSPFPGMDPYIESQGRWRDFHARFIACAADMLSLRLPDDYIAVIDEHVQLVSWSSAEARSLWPDVAVVREPTNRILASEQHASGVRTVEPVRIAAADREQEVRETWIEIQRLPERRLVTVIELLSPTNKGSSGRGLYLDKRWDLLHQDAHFVEIDLLLGGARMPMVQALPQGDYYASVFRTGHRPMGDVFAWTLRDPLPLIPIPLLDPDGDVDVNLAEIQSSVYERGRYERQLRYDQPLDNLPLAPEGRKWAETIARGGNKTPSS